MTLSNLFPNAALVILIQHIVMYFQACSNSAYPIHSGERYRTNDSLEILSESQTFFYFVVFFFCLFFMSDIFAPCRKSGYKNSDVSWRQIQVLY